MNDLSIKLSAYLDGELDATEAQAIEERLANEPEMQAELDALMEADALALEQFDLELADPVPFSLAQQIRNTPLDAHPSAAAAPPTPANSPSRPLWGTLAASLVIFAMGGAGGYLVKDQTASTVVARSWLTDIADYHAIYASQGRHLVEVGASESDHIETWLGNTVGANFTIPDLTAYDLTFEGGRLVVAAGKPVAQLMYRDPTGAVIALCLISSDQPATQDFKAQSLNGFDFVSWRSGDAAFVVIGPDGQPNLGDIAQAAAQEI